MWRTFHGISDRGARVFEKLPPWARPRDPWPGLQTWIEHHRVAAVLTLVAVALIARLIGLNRGLWIDELTTWDVTSWPMAEMLAQRFEKGHMPLYFMLMHGWVRLAGDAAWALRLPSVIFGVAGVYLAFRMGEEAWGPPTGWIAALLLALHANDIWSSQNARMYSMVGCLALGAGWALLRLERGQTLRRLAGYGALMLAGLLTHAGYLFMFPAHLIYLVVRTRGRIAGRGAALAAQGLALILGLPLLGLMAVRQQVAGIDKQINWPEPLEVIRLWARVVAGNYELVGYKAWVGAPGLALLGVVVGYAIVQWRRRSVGTSDRAPHPEPRDGVARPSSAGQLIACWAFGYWGFVYAASFSTTRDMAGTVRYYSSLIGVLCLAVAWTASRLRPGRRVALLALSGAALLPTTIGWWRFPGDGISQVARLVDSRLKPGERIVGTDRLAVQRAFQFYAPDSVAALTLVDRWGTTLQQNKAVLLENSTPGKGLWLIMYHYKRSPLFDAACDGQEFKIVRKWRIYDARVYYLKRRVIPESQPQPATQPDGAAELAAADQATSPAGGTSPASNPPTSVLK